MHGNLGSLQAATDIVRCPVFPPNMMLLQQVLQCKLAPVRYCNDRNVRILKCARIRASMEEPSGDTVVSGDDYNVVEARTYLNETFWKNIPRVRGKQAWMDDDNVDSTKQLRLQNLNHIALKVHDQALMEKFYIKVLGFQKLPRPEFPFGGAWLAAGELFLHLIEADPTVPVKIKQWKDAYEGEAPEPWYNRRGFHKAFLVGDLQATEDNLRHWGIEYDKFIVPGTGAAQIFFCDPEGNGIEVGSQYQTIEDVLKQAAEQTGDA